MNDKVQNDSQKNWSTRRTLAWYFLGLMLLSLVWYFVRLFTGKSSADEGVPGGAYAAAACLAGLTFLVTERLGTRKWSATMARVVAVANAVLTMVLFSWFFTVIWNELG
ncbi:hypothetical protein G1H11_19455 [Phytoactinopolyspora alkaliphila]|uniref:Uncharacterized protein n=1 Tax=Phytoactinopolyspora alkaliphila TaxID=1783498 RepID=A0A6N9YRA4_9ACTN|nr:hypothetical protein [Phytoactinopolyspora alkaliphila]NED97477.1 hypothetical protein [Phytoactinopolyspora alkaliphila]